MAQAGKALLLTSHILSEVDELADRVALIHRGRIPLVDTPAALKAAVGTRELIEIERATLSPATQAHLQELPSVLFTLERNPAWLSLAVADPLAGMEEVIGVLRQAGVRPRFRQQTVSLEDAFIHHIGALEERFEQ